MRRTLYIGLGGTGIKVIDEVKKQIISTHGNVPPLIKFLGIDADIHTLKNTTLESSEQLLVQDHCALNRYRAYKNSAYNDFPSKNADHLQEITTQYGSGACRSNASFLFMTYSCKFEQKISYILAELCNALYDGIGIQIDVHLCLSLCGGFGSGSYLEISKLIKKRIQNSIIIM